MLIEKEKVLGGKIETLQRDGFVVEKGPDSFLARKTAMSDLAKELKLDHELVTTNPNAKKTYILQRGKLHPILSGARSRHSYRAEAIPEERACVVQRQNAGDAGLRSSAAPEQRR